MKKHGAIFVLAMTYSFISGAMPLYGTDDRARIKEAPPELRPYTQAVAAVIPRYLINEGENPTFDMNQISSFSYEFGNSFYSGPLCESEKFYDDPVIAECTAFLVAPDLLATAGHCVSRCKDMAFVFDYAYAPGEYQIQKEIEADNLYFCQKIEKSINTHSEFDHRDMALIRLDREVVNRRPLILSRQSSTSCEDELLLIGHPYGVPMTYAKKGKASCESAEQGATWFMARLDSFQGNSGSPVINLRSGEVEGILAWGKSDYVFDPKEMCYHADRLGDEIYGEGVIRASLLEL